MYRPLLEVVWLSDFGRLPEVRNVPHLACIYNRCDEWMNSKHGFLRFFPCRAKASDGRQYPGCRFALPWATCSMPLRGVLNCHLSQRKTT